MPLVHHAEILEIVSDCFEKAREIAYNIIVFNEGVKRAKALMMASLPKFAAMPNAFGFAGWAAILSVDLRGSSARANRIGARDTFITMQTYLPSMAFLVGKADGMIVGLRGDGLFAAFGFKEKPGKPSRVAQGKAVQRAAACGMAMLQTVDGYIDPVLAEGRIESNLRIGVGIDAGEIVVTRIGWEDAQEVTTYGECVNTACKMKADHCIAVSEHAWDLYPKSETGRIGVEPMEEGLELVVPPDLLPLIGVW
jgi:adenylate cyclase